MSCIRSWEICLPKINSCIRRVSEGVRETKIDRHAQFGSQNWQHYHISCLFANKLFRETSSKSYDASPMSSHSISCLECHQSLQMFTTFRRHNTANSGPSLAEIKGGGGGRGFRGNRIAVFQLFVIDPTELLRALFLRVRTTAPVAHVGAPWRESVCFDTLPGFALQ